MRAVIVSKHMVSAAGGNLSPSFWLALEGIAQAEGMALDDSTIVHVIEAGKRRHRFASDLARTYRSQARKADEDARTFEDIARTLEPVVKERKHGRTTPTDPDC